jgi:hypothetical protein
VKQKSIVIAVGLVGLFAVAAFVLAFSPLSKHLFDSSGGANRIDDVFGPLIGILVLFGSGAIGITWIIACCNLSKRLGYDLYAGLLLIIPVVNVFVFFYWAFKESPNERRLRQLIAQRSRS